MKIQLYHVDAFTSEVFGGNPAAICPLEKEWMETETMQKIAMENALPETAFIIPCSTSEVQGKNTDGQYRFRIRWFTPEIEMDLCGHATLAAAHVIARHLLKLPTCVINFESASGSLVVTVDGQKITLDFPSRIPEIATTVPQCILDALQQHPIEVHKARDYLLLFKDEATIRALQPIKGKLDEINLDPGGVIVTAPGDSVDFVSRYFTPQSSIMEDPVTGSAHCSLIPFWADRLAKQEMTALQLSKRVGSLTCRNNGERVLISGEAKTFLHGTITL